ncbi:MAG: GTP-binding protein TypA/BipA, partial [uncultured Phycisphaerae bacterium]
ESGAKRHPKCCDHRPRRPRQDDAGRRPPAPERQLPRQPGAGHDARLQPARARAGHHDPGQERRDQLHRPGHRAGRQDQPDRHPGPRRLRRRGRAGPEHGRRRVPARRCGRGADAADPVRAQEGVPERAAADRRHQQDRPPGRPHRRRRQRGVRPVRRARGGRRDARLPDHLRVRPGRHRQLEGRGEGDGHQADLRRDPAAHPGPARGPGQVAAGADHEHPVQRLRRADRRRPDLQRRDQERPAGVGVEAGRDDRQVEDAAAAGVRRVRPQERRRGGGRRHRRADRLGQRRHRPHE